MRLRAPRTLAGREPTDVAPLGERMEHLQAVRVGFAALVTATALLAPAAFIAPTSRITVATAIYLLFSGISEAIRWLTGRRALPLVGLGLLADGVYLAWVVYSSGGVASPLRFLPFVHLVGVTLMASYRTGLKIAIWHSLLFLSVYYAYELDPPPGASRLSEVDPDTVVVLLIAGFWLAALVTSVLSYVNERELRRGKHELQCLALMASALEGEADPAAVGRVLLERLCTTFRLKRAVLLAAPVGGSLEPLAHRGMSELIDLGGEQDAIVKRAWAQREPLLVKKLDPDADRRLASMLPFARNLVLLPLFAEGQPIGVIAAESDRDAIQRRAVGMMSQFASHGALALRNAWLVQQIQRMADTDPLTGIANRRFFESMLARELGRARRANSQLSLMMVDVDHFKAFNDTHGHLAGDLALKTVASCLEKGCRNFDTVARYGGEEFSIILPECSPREAERIAQRLRGAAAALDVGAPLTVSIGLATFPVHAPDAHNLVRAADQALYESKRNGRDRVTSFGEGLQLPADVLAALREELQ